MQGYERFLLRCWLERWVSLGRRDIYVNVQKKTRLTVLFYWHMDRLSLIYFVLCVSVWCDSPLWHTQPPHPSVGLCHSHPSEETSVLAILAVGRLNLIIGAKPLNDTILKCDDSLMVLIGESVYHHNMYKNIAFRKTSVLEVQNKRTLFSNYCWKPCLFEILSNILSFLFTIRVRRMWLRSSTTSWGVRSGHGRPRWSTSVLSRTSSSCCSKGEVWGAQTYTTACHLQCWGVVFLCWLPHCLNTK